MLSPQLARDLQAAGLRWDPQLHDHFIIPDRDLDGKVFALNDLSTEVHRFGPLEAITFNGAVEWSLDWILSEDVIWLPTETQLRDALGNAFTSLQPSERGWCCRYQIEGEARERHAPTAADAYGLALLDLLTQQRAYRSA